MKELPKQVIARFCSLLAELLREVGLPNFGILFPGERENVVKFYKTLIFLHYSRIRIAQDSGGAHVGSVLGVEFH